MTTKTEALCDALERLEGYEYLDLPGPFAHHGPMGAEALTALGYQADVVSWAENYRSRHQTLDSFQPVSSLDPGAEASWRGALGDFGRVADWEAMFMEALQQNPWPQVLQCWLPRLLSGSAGGLTHGIIRSAHAVRALEQVQGNPPRPLLREMGRALAFWAAVYTILPGEPRLSGKGHLSRAIAGLPRPTQAWAPIEAGTFSRMSELTGFADAVDVLGPPPTLETALSDLSAAFCQVIVSNPDLNPIPLVHTVTPIGAVRILRAYLVGIPAERLYARLWHMGAAILCGFTPSPLATGLDDGVHGDLPDPGELASQAAEHQDPHVVKFTEVCIREYTTHRNPVYLVAADSVRQRTIPW